MPQDSTYQAQFGWIANDSVPKLTWNDILKPNGVADQAFEVVTPDPRLDVQKPNHEVLYGMAEIGILLGVFVTFFCLMPSKD